MSNTVKIVKLLTPYLMAFPQSKMNEGGLIIYAKAMEDVDLVEIEAAMNMLVKSARFFPTIAEILEQIEYTRGLIKAGSGDADNLTPAEAWEKAMDAVKSIGIYGEWELPPKVLQAVKQFGKYELCVLETDAVNTARSQFMRIYSSITETDKKRNDTREAVKSLGQAKVQQLLSKVSEKKMIKG